MKLLYCDSCFLITIYQEKYLGSLSQYKDQFYISETQINEELVYPEDLPLKIRQSVTVITDREEIKKKAKELKIQYDSLSKFDCLCMAFALIDGYCLVTDDKCLIKKCIIHNVETKTSKVIIEEFGLGGDDDGILK